MITIERALRHILDHITEGLPAKVPLEDALGLVILRDIPAKDNIPPFDNSAMDGFAVRSADTKRATSHNPVTLSVIESVPAGKIPKKRIAPGLAVKIMTGAPLPDGADAVIMVEDTLEDRGKVICFKAATRGMNIRAAGEDARKGSLILRRGAIIRPPEMGMLAALGITRAPVIRRPRVAILATGNELVPPYASPGPGRIRNCNNSSLVGLVKKYGGDPVDLGLAQDTPVALRRKLKQASGYDMVITSGGVSVGEYDLVKRVLREIGAEMKFWQVRVKPGKPLAFGIINKKPVFGLPGNPVSVIVSFEQFVRPALLKMMGRRNLNKPVIEAVLSTPVRTTGDRTHLIRAAVTRCHGIYCATPTGNQGSGVLTSLVKTNGLIIVPEGNKFVKEGGRVRVMMLDWPEQ